MKNEEEKRLYQYRKILKKAPVLYEISEELYKEAEEKDSPRRIVPPFVMAPVLCAFVLWVLEEAVRTGKERLYFLARDGYSMYQTAQIICKQARLPLECRYLYGSRYAWRSAEYKLLGEESLSFICMGGIDITFRKMMCRAGLTEQEAERVAQVLDFSDKQHNTLSYGEIKELHPRLADCSFFMKKLYAHADEKYSSVCGYLKQEGLVEEASYALVDSGWTGSLQKSLQNLLGSMGYQGVVEGYYFGLYEYPKAVLKNTYHTWFFGPRKMLRRKVYFSNSLFECIFSSPEGMTVGYKMKEAAYVPEFEKKENPNRIKIEYSTAYLTGYAKAFMKKAIKRSGIKAGLNPHTAAKLLFYFMGRPTVSEAREYGEYIFCDDVIGEKEQTVAAKLSYREVKENYLLHKGFNLLTKRRRLIHESAWIEGSTVLVMAPKAGKKQLRQCALYKYVLYLRKMMK